MGGHGVVAEAREDEGDDGHRPGVAEQLLAIAARQVAHVGVVAREAEDLLDLGQPQHVHLQRQSLISMSPVHPKSRKKRRGCG